jgi:glutamate/tyrosine decarboxylase-like PLP-dependent enzyme
MEELLSDAAQRAARYLRGLADREVAPTPDTVERLERLNIPLQSEPLPPELVLAELDDIASPATVASASGRYFGFVIGGSLPAALGANWLAGAWDQNAALRVMSPAAARLEDIAAQWLLGLLGLPNNAGVGFVTGATMANFTGLAAARSAVLARLGWDVENDGLFGAPPINVIVGDEVHVSLLKALAMLGLGRSRVTRVPVDGQGRMRPDALPEIRAPAIVCLQAGNVNTGAFDPAQAICQAAHAAGAWVHVDGAFGLWALASPKLAHLAAGIPQADSWATDAHKWLNVPYDSGLAIVRHPAPHRAAMSLRASYLQRGADEERVGMDWVPESSRRSRVIPLYALIRTLGAEGVKDLIGRTCRLARHMAALLAAASGVRVLNEVVLNQVLVVFDGAPDGDAAALTRDVIARVQAEGTCWAGGASWQGHEAMRISVSNWSTTDADIERSATAILACHRAALDARRG